MSIYSFVCLKSILKQIFSRIYQQEESGVSLPGGNGQQLLTLGLGLLATALAASYVTKLAKVICLAFATLRIFRHSKMSLTQFL